MIEYVIVRDQNRAQIGIIDLFQSVIWKRRYFGVGDFELYAHATAVNIALLKAGHYVSRPNDDEIGIIETVQQTFSAQDGKMIVASGRFAKSLLDRRVIYRLTGTQNRATILRGNVEAAARQLVQNNIIAASDAARNISFMRLGASAGISKTIVDDDGKAAQKQTTYEGLLSYTDELLEEYGLSARVTMTADKVLLYSVFEGADRSVGNGAGNQPIIFSQQFDNLLSAEYIYESTARKTTALVGGAGEELERFYSLYGGNFSGINRREVFIDAQSIDKTYKDDDDNEVTYTAAEYTALLNSAARQELATMLATESFSGAVDVTNSQYRYKEHYNLGDIVTVRDEDMGLSLSARIAVLTEVQDENGYSINIEFNS